MLSRTVNPQLSTLEEVVGPEGTEACCWVLLLGDRLSRLCSLMGRVQLESLERCWGGGHECSGVPCSQVECSTALEESLIMTEDTSVSLGS